MGKRCYSNNDMAILKDEFSKMLDDYFHVDERNNDSNFRPPVDVLEDKEFIYVEVELPEVEEKEVEISFEGRVLTIKGEKRNIRERADMCFHRIERNYGIFHRSLSIPYEIEEGSIKADMKNGVLNIVLKKKLISDIKKIDIVFEE